MFIFVTLILLVISFILALKSLRTVEDKPKVEEVKKSLDKDRIVFQSQDSSK